MLPLCVNCDYDLTGMRVEQCCPECGDPIWAGYRSNAQRKADRALYQLGAQTSISCSALALMFAFFLPTVALCSAMLGGAVLMLTYLHSRTVRHPGVTPWFWFFVASLIGVLSIGLTLAIVF